MAQLEAPDRPQNRFHTATRKAPAHTPLDSSMPTQTTHTTSKTSTYHRKNLHCTSLDNFSVTYCSPEAHDKPVSGKHMHINTRPHRQLARASTSLLISTVDRCTMAAAWPAQEDPVSLRRTMHFTSSTSSLHHYTCAKSPPTRETYRRAALAGAQHHLNESTRHIGFQTTTMYSAKPAAYISSSAYLYNETTSFLTAALERSHNQYNTPSSTILPKASAPLSGASKLTRPHLQLEHSIHMHMHSSRVLIYMQTVHGPEATPHQHNLTSQTASRRPC
jgi:hypothetical protein